MSNCSMNVMIEGKPAATVGSQAMNVPPHIPQGGPFQVPPTNQGADHHRQHDSHDQQQAGRPQWRYGLDL
jgi:uncharacterized Zn-binding protein involved in type VI secretion